MILFIDNYDSFSYNLYQLIGSINDDIKIIRNDELNATEIRKLNPEAIIISPGPKRPIDAGNCLSIVKELYHEFPILGVCLGHQIIVEAFGGEVSYAKKLMHGKSSMITIDNSNLIFKSLNHKLKVGRYHSLAAIENKMPKELEVIAIADDNEIMAVVHKDFPIYGLQFHPESILTENGKTIVNNFLKGGKIK